MVTPETPKDTPAPLSGDLAKMVESHAAKSSATNQGTAAGPGPVSPSAVHQASADKMVAQSTAQAAQAVAAAPTPPAHSSTTTTHAPALSMKAENAGEPIDRQEYDRQARAASQGALNVGEIQISAVPQQDQIAAALPRDFRGWLMLAIQNPGLFVTIMDGTGRWMSATTFVGKEEALHLVAHEVAVIMDRGVPTVSFTANASVSEEQLADELCVKMLAVPKLQGLGIQGSSGLQINRGELLRKGWAFFQKILPLIMPLLLGDGSQSVMAHGHAGLPGHGHPGQTVDGRLTK